jgi:hypothetical protein
MPEAVILQFDGVGPSEYNAVNDKLGIDMTSGKGDWPDGLLSHAAGVADSGSFVVTEVWESRQAQERCMESRLGSALAAGGVTVAPTVTWVPLLAYRTPGA